MRKEVKFENDSELKDFQEYDENKLAIAKICVLSTAPNSHQLNISEEVLRRDIGTIRGNFLVADMMYGDATTHTPNEVPVGYFLPNEDIEFEEVEKDGMKIVKAWAYAVLSKRYASAAYEMFVQDNHRATSIEMTVETPEDDEHEVLSFNAFGSTILGKTVAPSCKDAEMSLVRFAEEANNFFDKKRDSINSLKQFVEERKKKMAEKKSYKVDKTKEAMSTSSWSEVDKTELRNKIIEAKNATTLVKSVYLKVDEDWSSAPSEKLHYPVMQFEGDTLVYNKNALANAKARVVQNNETSVAIKIEKIYKSLGLDDSKGKEEDAKMAEIAFAAVDIGDMWGRVFDALHDRYPDGDWGSVYRIDGIYEQDNKKFAIIHRKDEDVKYRLDFSFTEEGLTLADEIVKVEMEIVETDDIKKFAEPEGAEKYTQFEIEGRKAWAKVIKKVQDHEGDGAYVDSIEDNHIIYTKGDVRYRVEADIKVDKDDKSINADIKWDTVKKDKDQKMAEMTPEEMAEKIGELQKNIEDRDNIIMEKDKKMGEMEKELSELREYKNTCMEKERACSVESVMNEVKDFVNDEQFKSLREEGMACEFSQIDAWSNKVKAIGFECGKKSTKKQSDIMSFAAPVENKQNQSGSVWFRL